MNRILFVTFASLILALSITSSSGDGARVETPSGPDPVADPNAQGPCSHDTRASDLWKPQYDILP